MTVTPLSGVPFCPVIVPLMVPVVVCAAAGTNEHSMNAMASARLNMVRKPPTFVRAALPGAGRSEVCNLENLHDARDGASCEWNGTRTRRVSCDVLALLAANSHAQLP